MGIDQGTTISSLPIAGDRGDVEIRHGRLNDGAGRDVVVDYIQASNDPRRPERSGKRYSTSPEVRLIGPANERESGYCYCCCSGSEYSIAGMGKNPRERTIAEFQFATYR